MNKISKTVLAACVLALGVAAGSAQATFINGTIGISDGGLTLSNLPTSMVDQLTSLTLGTAGVTSCGGTTFTGVCSPSVPATTLTIPAGAGPGAMSGSFAYTFGGDVFTFTFSAIGPITRNPNIDQGGGLIQDSLSFTGFGNVTDSLGNFQQTIAAIIFQANGSCTNAEPGNGTTCDAGTASSSWSATLNALGRNTLVPEPAPIALLGIALAALGFVRRRSLH